MDADDGTSFDLESLPHIQLSAPHPEPNYPQPIP
jgi:hypothetical protein